MSEKCTQNEREAARPPKWGSFLNPTSLSPVLSLGYLLFVYLCGPNLEFGKTTSGEQQQPDMYL